VLKKADIKADKPVQIQGLSRSKSTAASV
jgi:hypothetical protein